LGKRDTEGEKNKSEKPQGRVWGEILLIREKVLGGHTEERKENFLHKFGEYGGGVGEKRKKKNRPREKRG